MIGINDAVRIAIMVVCVMYLVVSCRILSYEDPSQLKQLNAYFTWFLQPSLEEPNDARYVNAFATDEDELQAIGE